MNNIKSFDLFQKITTKEIIQPTITGALISILGICLIFFLILKETIDYMSPTLKKETLIYQDKLTTEKIKVNFSMKFFDLPCPIISIDQEDTVGAHYVNIIDNIEKIRFTKENKKIIGNYSPFNLDIVQKSIKNGEACYVNGHITINKAPGDIHFSFHEFRNVWEFLVERPEYYSKINLSHKIYSLSFGDKKINSEILEKFGLNDYTQHFMGSEISMPDYIHNDGIKYNYDYYIKLIPHVFVDEVMGKEYFTYQYSLSHKKNIVEEVEIEMPIVKIDYDISPITLKITLHKKHFTKFLIHICALVGGVFVVFSIFNSIIVYLFLDNSMLIEDKHKPNWDK